MEYQILPRGKRYLQGSVPYQLCPGGTKTEGNDEAGPQTEKKNGIRNVKRKQGCPITGRVRFVWGKSGTQGRQKGKIARSEGVSNSPTSRIGIQNNGRCM